jgi:hypothetical protein
MPLRLWIAALLAGLPAIILRQGAESPAGAFSWGFPLLVFCGGWLWIRAAPRTRNATIWTTGLALIFLLPALGTRFWAEVLAQDLLIYVPPVDHIRIGVDQGAICLRGLGLLLGVAGLALAVLMGRVAARMVGLLLGAAVGVSIMELQLQEAARTLFERDALSAIGVTLGLPLIGLCGVILGALGGQMALWRLQCGHIRPCRRELGGLLLACLGALWVVRSPLPALLPVVTPPEIGGLPQGAPGLSVPLRALNPWSEGFIERAVERGQADLPSVWQCTGRNKTRWLDFPRLSVALAVPGERTVHELDSVISNVFERGLHRIFLVGEAASVSGPLREVLAYPALPFVLEAPPVAAHWVRLRAEEKEWLFGGVPAGDDAICVVLPDQSLTTDALYAAGRELMEQDGCTALSLTPLEHRLRYIEKIEQDPGCAADSGTQGAGEG